MRRTRFDRAPCPIARTADLIGDWWSPLVMREACSGVRRFEDFQARLDIPRASLASRLDRLVREDMLRKEAYQDHPVRHEYRLTRKGADFYAVLAAMWRWGDDWLLPEDERPLMLVDAATGREIRPCVVDESTGEPIDVRRVRLTRRNGPPMPLGTTT
jgi:DNA-binding HxlR family transcriptional regulator